MYVLKHDTDLEFLELEQDYESKLISQTPETIEIAWLKPKDLSIPLSGIYDLGITVQRKGIYIITDKRTGKPIYVGAGYGREGILGRLKQHVGSLRKFGIGTRNYGVFIGFVYPENQRSILLAERIVARTMKLTRTQLTNTGSEMYPLHFSKRKSVAFLMSGTYHPPDLLVKKLDGLVRKGKITKSKLPRAIQYIFPEGKKYEAEGDFGQDKPGQNDNARLVRSVILDSTTSSSPNTSSLIGIGSPRKLYEKNMEWETEPEPTTHQKQDFDSQLEDLGYAAAAAQTEAEAEALVGAMVPLAAQLIPRVKPLMLESSPAMVAGLGKATKLLHRDPKTRPLLRTMPTILHHTAAVLNRDKINGRRPTPKRAVKVLADQAAKVIASPTETRRALQHAHEMHHTH